MAGNHLNNQEQLVVTWTGEIFQPVRLYYRVHDRNKVEQSFRKMTSMEPEPDKERWVWLYDGEAKSLKFKNPYSSIPKERHPIILGSFYSVNDNEIYLDVGSIERATKAVVFFDKRIRRNIAEVCYCAIYNKLIPQSEHPGTNFDKLFAGVKTDEIESIQMAKLERMATSLKSGNIMGVTQDRSFELVEAFPCNYYSDGIKSFDLALQMRQVVAFKRWQGEDFTLTDAINQAFSIPGEPQPLH
ncbi:conserved hypothetical protein [Gammaproteobacteria bacterium]